VKLVDAYTEHGAMPLLYDLLAERPAEANISHRKMPALVEHARFFASRPYTEWYLIEVDGEYVGAIYLTVDDEIGVSIFKSYWGRGYAPAAISLLMKAHPRERYLANVAPGNARSARMFQCLGFKALQHTYELRP
jgi:RimJ/RimL family protein N-acetyltransferase